MTKGAVIPESALRLTVIPESALRLAVIPESALRLTVIPESALRLSGIQILIQQRVRFLTINCCLAIVKHTD